MKILRCIDELSLLPGPLHLAIGVFDGVHRGHQEVIRRAVEGARTTGGRAVVVTFEPHPVRVLRPSKAPRLLTSLQQKGQLIEELGVDAVLAITFTRAFARTPPETFVQKLYDAADRLREICVGQGWNFGANRAGGIALLTSLARRLGFQLNAVPSVLIDGKVVSSTSVRVAVQRGDLKEAARLLGRPFYWQIAYNFAWAQEMAEMEHRATDAADPIDIVFEPGARAHS